MKALSTIGVFFSAVWLCGCAGAGLKSDRNAIDWEQANPLFTVTEKGTEAALPDTRSLVYASYDTSEEGMKKIYEKIRSKSKGVIDLHLYGPDAFWDKTVPTDLGAEFTRVIEQDSRFGSNLTQYGDRRKTDSSVVKPHKFRFADCMCYLQVEEQGQRCAKLPWFASPRCRWFMDAYTNYQKQLFSSPVLVVLSRFSETEPGKYEGAVKNMLGGNTVLSSLNSLANLWARRMAKPAEQRTWFVNIVYAPDGAARAIVASENMVAAEMESLRIVKGLGGREAFVSTHCDDVLEDNNTRYKKTNPGLYSWWRDMALMHLLGQKYAPEEYYALAEQKGRVDQDASLREAYLEELLVAEEERFSPMYRVEEIK